MKKIPFYLLSMALPFLVSFSAFANAGAANTIPSETEKLTPAGYEAKNTSETVLKSILNYNADNYQTQMAQAKKYFTEEGWKSYQLALEESGNLKIVQENRLNVTANIGNYQSVTMNPKPPFNWQVVFPVTMSYQSASKTLTQESLATVSLEQNPQTHQLQVTGIIIKPIPKAEKKSVPANVQPSQGSLSNAPANH